VLSKLDGQWAYTLSYMAVMEKDSKDETVYIINNP